MSTRLCFALALVMASSSDSTVLGHDPIHLLETEIRELRRKVRDQKRFIKHLHEEGGRIFEMVEANLMHLHKDFSASFSQSVQALQAWCMEMEAWFDKL